MNIDFDIFKIRDNNIKPHRGCVLISDPFSQDLYFKRSVVLLSEYNDDGAIGFILNKPTDESLNNILEDFEGVDIKVSVGGPVSTDTVHFIHTLGENIPNSVNIFENLFWGGDFNKIKDNVSEGIAKNDDIRFFVGYSGWQPNQLEMEIKNNFWLVSDFNVFEIMKMRSKDLWKYALGKLGDTYKQWLNYPENPYLN
jgi:putative transcriptional regulator